MAEVFFPTKNFAKLFNNAASGQSITDHFFTSKERSVAGQLKTNLFQEISRYSKKLFKVDQKVSIDKS